MTTPIRTNRRTKRPVEIRAQLRALEAVKQKDVMVWTIISTLRWVLGDQIELL